MRGVLSSENIGLSPASTRNFTIKAPPKSAGVLVQNVPEVPFRALPFAESQAGRRPCQVCCGAFRPSEPVVASMETSGGAAAQAWGIGGDGNRDIGVQTLGVFCKVLY